MNSQTNDTPRSYGAPKSAGYESAWHARLLGVVGAVLLAELIWCGVALVAGLQLQAPATQTSAQPSSIGPIDVGVASVIASLVAWAVAFGFQRLGWSRGAWLGLALVGLAVSLIMPLSGWAVSVGDRIVLLSMHVAVAAVVVPVLYATWSSAQAHDAGPGRQMRARRLEDGGISS